MEHAGRQARGPDLLQPGCRRDQRPAAGDRRQRRRSRLRDQVPNGREGLGVPRQLARAQCVARGRRLSRLRHPQRRESRQPASWAASSASTAAAMATSRRPAKSGGTDSVFPDVIDDGIASPLLHGGRLYLMSNKGRLFCLDAVTGKKIWKFDAGRRSEGSPVWADGKIYLTTARSDVRDPPGRGRRLQIDRQAQFQDGRREERRNLRLAGGLRRPHRGLYDDRDGLLRQERRDSGSRCRRRSCRRRPRRTRRRPRSAASGRGPVAARRNGEVHGHRLRQGRRKPRPRRSRLLLPREARAR